MPNLNRLITGLLGGAGHPLEDADADHALRDASDRGALEDASRALDRGADPNALPAGLFQRRTSGSAVHRAARNGDAAMLRMLLNRGGAAQAPNPDDDGRTPLHSLAEQGAALARRRPDPERLAALAETTQVLVADAVDRGVSLMRVDAHLRFPAQAMSRELDRSRVPTGEQVQAGGRWYRFIRDAEELSVGAAYHRPAEPDLEAPPVSGQPAWQACFTGLPVVGASEAGFTPAADTSCCIVRTGEPMARAPRGSAPGQVLPVLLRDAPGREPKFCDFNNLARWVAAHGTHPLTLQPLTRADLGQWVRRIDAPVVAPAPGRWDVEFERLRTVSAAAAGFTAEADTSCVITGAGEPMYGAPRGGAPGQVRPVVLRGAGGQGAEFCDFNMLALWMRDRGTHPLTRGPLNFANMQEFLQRIEG